MRDAQAIRFPLFRFATSLRRRLVSAIRFQLSDFSVSAFQNRRYFSSGWAFLIPYLAAYLLYYVLKWPVNPVAISGQSPVVSSQWSAVSGLPSVVPCLLHVYWLLHAINLVLGAFALRAWWRKEQDKGERRTEAGERSQTSDGLTQGREDAKMQDAETGNASPTNEAAVAKALAGRHESTRIENTPLSSLPPVKWSGLRFLRFHDFTISRFSARFPAFPLSRFAASPLPSPFSLLLQRLAPWFLLALVFYIPGVYLEFPADPWQHFARINEWSWLHTVGEHSAWAKSSYFLAYSFLGQISPPTRQLFWLDFYYTGCCLLLCWQYYRLARAVGLGERASMLFVILQTVLFGNNIFGFYRYYGISSSIFAQIGAVALTRVAIEYASQKFQVPRLKFQGTGASPSVTSLNTEDAESTESAGILGHEKAQDNTKALVPFFARLCAFLRLKEFAQPAARGAIACKQAPIVSRIPAFPHFRFFAALLHSPFSLLQAGASAFALLLLIAFNHVQGLGIAGLGLLAVAIWRLIKWRRSTIWWLAAGAVALSIIAVLWFPRDPALAGYVRDGWLTSWYGFNVFAFHLPVGDRTLWILGLFGLVNLAAGLLLLRHNSIVGWLTIIPLFALCLPFVAMPLAGVLARHGGPEGIITLQRLLFAIPGGLALVVIGAQMANGKLSFVGISQEETKATKNQKVEAETIADLAGKPTAHGNIACRSTSSEPSACRTGDQAYPALCFKLKALSSARRSVRFLGFSLPHFSVAAFRLPAFPVVLLSLAALLVGPANRPFYNRFWQALMVPADDLAMRNVVEEMDTSVVRIAKARFNIPILTTYGQGAVVSATGVKNLSYAYRSTWTNGNAMTWWYGLPGAIMETGKNEAAALVLIPITTALLSPCSITGRLSGHWLPQAAILEYGAGPEIEIAARKAGGRKVECNHGMLYSFGDISALHPP